MRTLVFLFVFAVILNFPISKSSAELFSPTFKNLGERIQSSKKIEELKKEDKVVFEIMMQNYEKFKTLSDEDKEKVLANYSKFKALSTKTQENLQKNSESYFALPKEKQNQLSDRFKRLQKLSPSFRQKLLGDVKFRSKLLERGKLQRIQQRKIKIEKIRKQMQLRQRRTEAGSIV
jgi:hypothetical protein